MVTKPKKKMSSREAAERARKEAWLARSRPQLGSSVGDVPMSVSDQRNERPIGHRIGDT